MNFRSILLVALVHAVQFALADDPTNPTVSPTPAPTAAPTPAPTAPPPTNAPNPGPGDNPLDDGKKFGISVLVYVCCLIVWIVFLFLYSRIVDYCMKKKALDGVGQKYATSSTTPAPGAQTTTA